MTATLLFPFPARQPLAREPKQALKRRRAEYARRLIRASGVPLQRHRISDDGILEAYAALRERTEE